MPSKIIEMVKKNTAIRDGEEVVYDGQTYIIGKMDEDEIKQMISEGTEIGNKEVTYKGTEGVKLVDIKNGKDVYNIISVIEIDGNIQAFWYIWREARIAERKANLSEKGRKDLEELLKLIKQ